jgi:outer membrane protein OmpA-like peptidoglycan-associated protein
MSYLKQSLGLLFVVGAFTTTSIAQTREAAWKTKADRAYSSLRYHDALQALLQGYAQLTTSGTQGDNASAVAARIADCYWLMRNYDSAYRWYSSLSGAAMADVKSKVRLSDLLATRGQYALAAKMLEGVSGYEKKGAGFSNASGLTADSADYRVQFLETINTPSYREFSPTSADGGLVWSTNIPVKGGARGVMGWDNNGYTRLMRVATLDGLAFGPTPGRSAGGSASDGAARLAPVYDLSDFEKPLRMTVPAASKDKVAAIQALASPVDIAGGLSYNQAHSAYDAKTGRFFFSANRQEKLKDRLRTVGLVTGKWTSGAVAEARFVFPDGQDHSIMHPAIHPDGTQLVFASDRKGGKGGYDLYVVSQSGTGDWSEPRTLEGANTAGHEMFPSFAPDGRLYFSSDGMAGLGCLDIYTASFQGGKVSDVRHVPYPVNSPYDDFGMALSADGKSGYFSSDRAGSDDIYSYAYEKKTVKVEGTVLSESSGSGKPGVTVILERKNDAQQFEQVAMSRTDAKGAYSFNASPGRPYRIQYIDGDRKLSQEITAPAAGASRPVADVVLKDPVKSLEKTPDSTVDADKVKGNDVKGATGGDRDRSDKEFKVFFNFNSYEVRDEDMSVLQEVSDYLKSADKTLCILSGHTDAEGSERINMRLSMRRVMAVKKKLTQLGVSASRLSTEYFGESRLARETSDRTEAMVNRRVEILLKFK